MSKREEPKPEVRLPNPGQIVDDRRYLGNGCWVKLNIIPK